MYLKIVILLIASSSLSILSRAQSGDSLSIDDPEMDSLVQMLLNDVYGTLKPDIVDALADSGLVDGKGMKTGKWNIYSYKQCVLCGFEQINYDSLVKINNEDSGNLFFIKQTGHYSNNMKSGTWLTYSTDRLAAPFTWKLDSKVSYVNNLREGWEERYLISFDSSQYIYRKVFFHLGEENGPEYGFDQSGDTTLIGQYKNGLEQGLFKFRKSEELKVSFDRVYDRGLQVETIFYHPNGKISSRGLLIDFKPHGMQRVFDESGRLFMEQQFFFGVTQGETRIYYENGNLKMKQNYKDDHLEGQHIYYHPNGQIWSELVMKTSKPWTVVSNFDKNGKSKSKGSLKNGTGTMKRYSEEGKLLSIDYYKNGELIKEESKKSK